ELVAAVILNKGTAFVESDVRTHVMDSLSTYKVPSCIIVVDDFPRNATGKIVRRELGTLLADRFKPRGQAPSSALEERLCAFWSERLGIAVGATDNLYVLGLDPISAGQYANELEAMVNWTGGAKAVFL